MKMLKLPLVEALLDSYKGADFSKIKIIGAQHILETTHSMFQALYKFGLKPENISILGKCYSTCREVYNEMVQEGIDVGSGSFSYSSHSSYDEQYALEVRKFLRARLDDLRKNKYERIIVLDDGGKCIQFLSQQTGLCAEIIAVEQTTAGYEAIKNANLVFPLINVARSPTKLSLESPMIANAAGERLYQSLERKGLTPKSALVIGGGAIGSAIKNRLAVDMEVFVYDQNNKRSDYSENLESLLSSFPLIIGCTGRISVPHELHQMILPGTALVSVSSSDREFDAVSLRLQIPKEKKCHKDLLIDQILLVNSGFPINFDGCRENIEPNKIQLTIALITAAILQGREQPLMKMAKILPLNEQTEEWIAQSYLRMNHQELCVV